MVEKYTLVLLLVSLANVSVADKVIEGAWIVEDGDDLNPDPGLRKRPLLGLAIFSNLLKSTWLRRTVVSRSNANMDSQIERRR